jgi:hypothetical protein
LEASTSVLPLTALCIPHLSLKQQVFVRDQSNLPEIITSLIYPKFDSDEYEKMMKLVPYRVK